LIYQSMHASKKETLEMSNTRKGWTALRQVFAGLIGVLLAVCNVYAASVTLKATGRDGRIDLSWATTDKLRAVQVMRDTDADPSGRKRMAILNGGARSYTDTSVTNGRRYWYWIKYTDTGRNTSNSNSASATPVASNNVGSYTLQLGVSGNGTTSVSAGSHSYKSGTAVSIKATPAQGFVFAGWSGAFTGNTNPLTVTMNGNKSLTATFAAQNDNGNSDPNNGAGPKEGTVRVFWVHPSDVPADTIHPDGIAMVMKEVQRYYKQELGRTFLLNDPVVEVVTGNRPQSYYENTPQWGEKYWYSVANMQIELLDRFKLNAPDNRWILVGEISAEGDGAGGGGGNGWVILSQHDADGAAGIGGDMNRWYGGMAHELGHALGLPDSTYTDGTPMSASFYGYPNTHFSQEQKDRILNGPYGSFLH
jgi:uncharacterized repeat protein (TIGR02543 family)